ncbi:peptidoglycan editing factor PgeF [Undibacterium fentianense]|uniref:Purine nucleoside phosphorylase n=1 Tax=Undibacterium fentianense TaxID=2828728 RepID=A0A941DZT8_9BURK|nr:peptidoglycan editing factor PgeF [Undibacterium fentianense]MBR7798652.1 peptidoglycan editing factor PgeF [Undibacterium fentianense]
MSLICDDETGLTLIRPDWPDCPSNVMAYSSTRIGGVSHGPYGDIDGDNGLNLGDHVGDQPNAVQTNRQCIGDFMPAPVTFLSQKHGIICVNGEHVPPNDVPAADAIYTTKAGLTCAVLTADCLPILLASLDGFAVGAVHAGWRGLLNGVVESAVESMRHAGASAVTAWLGPAIGPQAFEVGEDVFHAFVSKSSRFRPCFVDTPKQGKWLADLYGLARIVLQQQGIKSIAGGEFCTFTQKELFYSFRREQITGRMASWIWIT